jgi:hypothetical protein
MKHYRYAIVCSNGASHDLGREETFYPYGLTGTVRYDLPLLLRKGWRPVRETPMGGTEGAGGAGHAFSLVVLEKEQAESEPPVAEAVPE